MHEIVLNGETRGVAEGSTVLSLLNELGIPAERVAVELDRVILQPAAWSETPLRPGARLEIVHFVGGGRR
jgi:thiamine biosynthesis protein ThiS